MLKKKIHPDIEGKIQKSEGPNKAIVREHPAGNQYRATDTVSLLQTQGTCCITRSDCISAVYVRYHIIQGKKCIHPLSLQIFFKK